LYEKGQKTSDEELGDMMNFIVNGITQLVRQLYNLFHYNSLATTIRFNLHFSKAYGIAE